MDTDSEREFCSFVTARSQALFRTAYLLTGHAQTAEDLVQTALTRLAVRWSRVDQPEAYVRRIMYHQQVSRWRLRSWGRETSATMSIETALRDELRRVSDIPARGDASRGPVYWTATFSPDGRYISLGAAAIYDTTSHKRISAKLPGSPCQEKSLAAWQGSGRFVVQCNRKDGIVLYSVDITGQVKQTIPVPFGSGECRVLRSIN